jgi:hypothetical protein
MSRILGLMITMLVCFSMDMRAVKKSAQRHPASIKIHKEIKKIPDKKVREHYAEHLFNQAMETPLRANETGH